MKLPDAVLAQHSIALGKTRSGKSSALRYLVEQQLDAKRRVCILDPKGDWFGLKSSADGKNAGYPVVIFGGEHADVPLNERAGIHVAELIATGNRPSLIDLGGWHVGERTRFFIDFASTLFRTAKAPLLLVIDECHNFCPQGKILDPDAGKMLHWSNRLASEGGGKGIILLAASQRPQKVHKDFVTSMETLMAFRVVHNLDRQAMKDWIDGAPDRDKGKEVLESLATMPRGEAWVWSPEIGFGPKRVVFPRFSTFDSFAAPTGDKATTLKGWAEVDLDEVREKLAQVVQEAQANDPKLLKAELAKAKAALAAVQKAATVAPPAPPKIVEKPVLKEGQLARIEKLAEGLKDRIATFGVELGEFSKVIKPAAAANYAKVAQIMPDSKTRLAPSVPRPSCQPRQNGPIVATSKRQQRFLDAAAALTTLGTPVTRETVSAWVGVHPRGGSVGEELKTLVDGGLITMDRGSIAVTPDGMNQAEPMDSAAAFERAKAGLSPRQAKFFEAICEAYPGGITRQDIAERFGIHPRGGSLGEDLGRLVGRGLVDGERGVYRTRDFLFTGR